MCTGTRTSFRSYAASDPRRCGSASGAWRSFSGSEGFDSLTRDQQSKPRRPHRPTGRPRGGRRPGAGRKRNEPWYKGVTYYIGYCFDVVVDGRRIRRKKREAVGPKKSEATARLAQRLRELDDGKWQDPTKPLTLDDLLALVKADWRNNGK